MTTAPHPSDGLPLPTVARTSVERVDRGLYVAEASSIGLPPGEWPASIDVDLGTEAGDGSPVRFIRGEVTERDGDVIDVLYATASGDAYLRIWND